VIFGKSGPASFFLGNFPLCCKKVCCWPHFASNLSPSNITCSTMHHTSHTICAFGLTCIFTCTFLGHKGQHGWIKSEPFKKLNFKIQKKSLFQYNFLQCMQIVCYFFRIKPFSYSYSSMCVNSIKKYAIARTIWGVVAMYTKFSLGRVRLIKVHHLKPKS